MKMQELTKAELLELLEEVPDEAIIRFAVQPNYPLQHHIRNDAMAARYEDGIVWLADGGQVHDEPYLPGEISEQLGWR